MNQSSSAPKTNQGNYGGYNNRAFNNGQPNIHQFPNQQGNSNQAANPQTAAQNNFNQGSNQQRNNGGFNNSGVNNGQPNVHQFPNQQGNSNQAANPQIAAQNNFNQGSNQRHTGNQYQNNQQNTGNQYQNNQQNAGNQYQNNQQNTGNQYQNNQQNAGNQYQNNKYTPSKQYNQNNNYKDQEKDEKKDYHLRTKIIKKSTNIAHFEIFKYSFKYGRVTIQFTTPGKSPFKISLSFEEFNFLAEMMISGQILNLPVDKYGNLLVFQKGTNAATYGGEQTRARHLCVQPAKPSSKPVPDPNRVVLILKEGPGRADQRGLIQFTGAPETQILFPFNQKMIYEVFLTTRQHIQAYINSCYLANPQAYSVYDNFKNN